jgi:diaminopimelate decarboxylase
MHDLPPLRRGDLLAIADTGAYAASLASTYNGRPRAPQVFLELDGRLTLARRART